MIDPVLFDIESQSRADLSTIGGRAYWRHPSTRTLCAAWYDTASGDAGIWHPGEAWPHHGRVLAAHNASGFDRFGAVRNGWATLADPWIDTSELARTAGLPGALDALGTRWLGLPKDKEASRFTASLSSVRRPAGKGPNAIPADVWRDLDADEKRTRGVLPEITPEVMARVDPYCLWDVEILAHGWEDLRQWVDLEPDVASVDRAINDRGVYLDRELCEALLVSDEILVEQAIEEVARELCWGVDETRDAASSPARFCSATGAPDAQKATVDALDHPLARARAALASIARGKLRAGLSRADEDSRLRDTHLYYGGHTGRWANLGMQLHNLTKPAKAYEKWSDDQICALADSVREADHVATSDEIKLLLRATISAPPGKVLSVCDFAGVEARALAWVANDAPALADYRAGRIAYFTMAAKLFGKTYESIVKGSPEYALGKQLELACGYGQGHKKFAGVCAQNGIDLRTLGIDAESAVNGWRRLHAASVRLWYECERGFRSAIGGSSAKVACFDFSPSESGQDVAVFLPSGRPVVYRNARIDGSSRSGIIYEGGRVDDTTSKSVPYCPYCWSECGLTLRKKRKTYRCATHGEVSPVMRVRTYGGKIVENLIQALCRDLLAGALVHAEAAGLSPVMHVHDEIVCEVDECAGTEAYETLREWMLALPSWAVGFPIGASGFVGRRYRK